MNIQKLEKVKKNPIYHLQKVDKLFSASKQAWLLFKSSAEMFAKKRLESFSAILATSAAIFISSPAISVSFPIILDSGSCSTYAMWQLDVWRGNTKPQNCSSLLVIRTTVICYASKRGWQPPKRNLENDVNIHLLHLFLPFHVYLWLISVHNVNKNRPGVNCVQRDSAELSKASSVCTKLKDDFTGGKVR